MDVDEKLNAVKKAYADIILNISKEAAARVLASEKKAARYQQELKMAKEEAIRMLVRLKEMMDAKLIASEAASLNQQKKIEEVEAQLQEAEDIVNDLREELRETQAKLEKVKTQSIQSANKSGNFLSNEIPTEVRNRSYLSSMPLALGSQDDLTVPSPVTTTNQSMTSESHKYSNKVGCMRGSYTGNQDLPSIILRGKRPGLYRNVFTHRIRACERNQLCFSARTDNVKNGTIETGTIDDKETGKLLDSEAKSTSLVEKEQFSGEEAGIFESQMQKKRRTQDNYSPVTENCILSNISAIGDPTLVNENAYLSDNTELSGKESLVEDGVVEVPNPDESNKLMVPTSVKIGKVETSLSLNQKKDVEIINSSEEIISNEPASEKDFRFTFQRKRKKEALSSSTDVIEKKSGDEMNSSDQKLELSRDQRRLAQVARQLISLSGKKWWQ